MTTATSITAMTRCKGVAALILLSTSLAAFAQMPGGPPPPHGHGAPSPEALATIPNLTAAQQSGLRKILLERRDAHEAVAAKSRAERDALAKKDRSEHERIDEQEADKLRQLLGDEGYRAFAQWQLEHHRGGRGPQGMPDVPRHGPPRSGNDKVALGPDVADPVDDRDD